MPDEKVDPELQAIATLLTALEPLGNEARVNVILYVFKRLGIDFPASNARSALRSIADVAVHHASVETENASVIDIRSFKEEKQPKTASEMVAIAAYYLAHLAPLDERRDYIVADDIRKYFLQAVFPLPSAPPHMTLVNAKNAGYVDARERGQYRLNPVGYNLVTNKLPPPQTRVERRPESRVERRPATTRKGGGPTKTEPRS
jgi:hypothetical protein